MPDDDEEVSAKDFLEQQPDDTIIDVRESKWNGWIAEKNGTPHLR